MSTIVRVMMAVISIGSPALADEKMVIPRWPQFRGEAARGIADEIPAPIDWNVDDGTRIRWKTPIPGLGYSSPVIWGDRLFITTAVNTKDDRPEVKVGLYGNIESIDEPEEHSFRVLCLDRGTGRILWDQEACRAIPRVKRHRKSSHANSTPATDGTHLLAFFGSEGMYCYNMEGKLLWKKDFGLLDSGYFAVPDAQWGFGSSPVIHDGRVIIQCDVQQNSFLAAFDVRTGAELWRSQRKDVPTWSTPTVYVGEPRSQVVVNGLKHIGGYDLATGKEIWRLRGGGDIPVPTPVVAGELIYITNAHGSMAPIYAIKTGAKGRIKLNSTEATHPQVAWWNDRGGNYMQTPIVYRRLLYCCRDNGVLSCFDAVTGETKYRERLVSGTGFTASGVASAGRLYFTSEEGEVFVVRAGPEFERLAMNNLNEVCMATPAVVDGHLYFRTVGHVIAVGGENR
ncbi:MAG: PQQ-binding-like beta-propeller repeat protein [Phycisphaerae bacterium]|nr:PQQ-binding-like beta-propeller repeat protein [Phycisphaerae bacterium]